MATLTSNVNINQKSDLQHAYNLLTNKLRKLNYNYPVGIESTQLVDKILTQLISTTEGYQKLSNKFTSIKADLEAEKKNCLPLRNENMKLVKENNDLHLEMIKMREDFERKEITLKNSISKLDKEKQETRFLLKQKDTHINNLSKETEEIRKKFNEITEKIYGKNKKGIMNNQSTLNKIGEISSNININLNVIGKKQEIIMPRGIEPNDFEFPTKINNLFKKFNLDKEEWANDIKTSDDRLIKFRDEVKRLEETNKNLLEKIEFMYSQISQREQEIKRITSSYSVIDNMEELKMKYETDTYKSQIEKLNSQIDFLNKDNKEKDEALKVFYNLKNFEDLKKNEKTFTNLKKENDNLKKELQDAKKNTNENYNNNDNNNNENSNQNYNQTLIKENLTLKKENSNLQQKLEDLKINAENLLLENDKLKNLNSENSSYVNSDRAALLKNLNLLKDEIKDLKIQIGESQKNAEITFKQNENLKSELNLMKGKELSKNSEIEKEKFLFSEGNSNSMNKIQKEYSDLSNENKNLRKKIDDLEHKNLLITKTQNSLMKENEANVKINENLEKKLYICEEELSKFKFLSDNNSTFSQKMETQIFLAEEKNKNFEEEILNLNKILDNKNSLIKEIENKSENYFSQIQNANETIANLQGEFKTLSKELTDLHGKNKRYEEKVRSYEKNFNENKYVKEKLLDYEENLKGLKNEKVILDKENKFIKSENIKLQEELNFLKIQENENKDLIELLREEKNKVLNQLENKDKNLNQLEDKLGNKEIINKHYEEIKAKNNEYLHLISNKNLEIENLNNQISISKFEVKKRENEINRQNENLEANKIELNAKIEEIKYLKEQIDILKAEIFEKKITNNSNISISLLELQEKYTQEKIQMDKLNYNNKELNEKLKSIYSEKENLSLKVTEMTKLLAEADNTRAEMFSKIQQEINKSKFFENENLLLKEKEQKNLKDLLNLQDENNNLKNGISSLDNNYDILNNELDLKTEEISKLNLLLKNLNDANDEISKKLSVQLSKCSTDTKRLSERDLEIKEQRIINSKIQKENMELNSLLQQKNIEFQELNFEIRRLSEENENLQQHMLKMTKENEKLSLIKSQLEKNSEMIANKYRANELDSVELFNSYKDACKENERLKKNLQIFIEENKEAFNHIKNIESNLSSAMNNIQSQIIEKETLMKKIEMMEIYNNEQNIEIERLRKRVENKISNEEKLKKNMELEQEINMDFENHTLKLQKEIAKLDNEKKEYEEIIRNLRSQIEYMNILGKKQENEMANLEIILVDERKKLHRYDCLLNKEKEEMQKLKLENNQLIEMMQENSDVKNLKNKIIGKDINNNNNKNSSFDNLNNSKNSNNSNNNPNNPNNNENTYKLLIHDLQSQLFNLQNDLKTVREEYTRVLSERSSNVYNSNNKLFCPSSPSSKSEM